MVNAANRTSCCLELHPTAHHIQVPCGTAACRQIPRRKPRHGAANVVSDVTCAANARSVLLRHASVHIASAIQQRGANATARLGAHLLRNARSAEHAASFVVNDAKSWCAKVGVQKVGVQKGVVCPVVQAPVCLQF